MNKETLEKANRLLDIIKSLEKRLSRLKSMKEACDKSESVACNMEFVNTKLNDQRVGLGHDLTMKILPLLIEDTENKLKEAKLNFEKL